MAKHIHDTQLEFPNGLGYTPCTSVFKEKSLRARELNDKAHTSDEGLTNDEYNELGNLENELGCMQLDGHLGRSVRY